jgi:saccharopine dehydrogenase (NAD+, L-lysine-forming)
MEKIVGIRREDKNLWERRVPLIPSHITTLIRENDLEFLVQPSRIRAYRDKEYEHAGARIAQDLSSCDVVFGVKEMSVEIFEHATTYVFFAHVIKGQKYNMPMLKTMMERRCTLIDYERITDDSNRRLVFFGLQAGMAGFVDGMWALGQRLDWEDIPNPFDRIRPTHTYLDLHEIEADLDLVAERLEHDGLPEAMVPCVLGFAGYGHVSQGAQSLFHHLPYVEITPQQLLTLRANEPSRHKIYKVVFKEEDMVVPKDAGQAFELQDYYDHPEKYQPIFERYMPHLTVLYNCIYWDARYPRLVTKQVLRDLYAAAPQPALRVLGDITCDIEGSIECNVKISTPGNPVYVWDPSTGAIHDGVAGTGPVVLAVDNLPCEIARESSEFFSRILMPFVPEIAQADYRDDFDHLQLPKPIKRAVILHQGRLAPDYQYLERSVE